MSHMHLRRDTEGCGCDLKMFFRCSSLKNVHHLKINRKDGRNDLATRD